LRRAIWIIKKASICWREGPKVARRSRWAAWRRVNGVVFGDSGDMIFKYNAQLSRLTIYQSNVRRVNFQNQNTKF